jgi:hypothetical protein
LVPQLTIRAAVNGNILSGFCLSALHAHLSANALASTARRGSHTSVPALGELDKATLDHMERRNRDPKPLARRADADLILGKVERFC